MPNNTKLTLSGEIKSTLLSMNYPFLIVGSFVISVLGTLMVLGHYPENFSAGIMRIFGFTLTMTAILIGILIGTIIGFAVGQYCRPRILRYTNAPNEIEVIRDGLIALGSFVTTMENTVNSKQIGSIFRNIGEHLKKNTERLDHHDSEIQILKEQIPESDKNHRKEIEEIKKAYMREFQLMRIKYDRSERARINAESALESINRKQKEEE